MIKAFVFDAYGTLYDVQSVATAAEAAFPGRGDFITQVWRMKQLEYTWLRTLMGRYEDFRSVTRASLRYTLATLGEAPDDATLDRLAAHYDRLAPYPEAAEALGALSGFRRAILSNGSPGMLDALVANSALSGCLDDVISVDDRRMFKPHPAPYELVAERLGVAPDEVIFVSSNSFDVAGAKSFGFRVAWIERVSASRLAAAIAEAGGAPGPAAIFMALRTRPEALGFAADHVIGSLLDLPRLADAASAESS